MPQANLNIIADLKDRVSGKLDGISSKIKAIGAAGAGIGKVVAAVAATGAALVAATNQAIAFADSIAKAADVAGITTTTLQELRFAFSQMGVDSRLADESLRRFNRRLGEFTKSGGGPAKAAFEQLGLSAEIFEGNLVGTEDTLNAFIDRLAQIEDPAQRAALAAQAFGDDAGPKMALALSKGIGAINDLRQQAHELGIVLDESVIREAEIAGDELDKMGQIIKVQLVAGFLELVPQVRQFAQYLIDNRGVVKEWVVEFANMAKQILQVAGAIANATIEMAKFFGVVEYDIDEQLEFWENLLNSGIDERIRFLGPDGLAEYYSDEEILAKIAALKEEKEQLQQLTAQREQEVQQLRDERQARSEANQIGLTSISITEESTKAEEEKADAILSNVDAYQKLIEEAEKAAKLEEQRIALVERASKAWEAGDINDATFLQVLKELNAVVDLNQLERVETIGVKLGKMFAEQNFQVSEAKDAVSILTNAYKAGDITLRQYNNTMLKYLDILAETGDAEAARASLMIKLDKSIADGRREVQEARTAVDLLHNAYKAGTITYREYVNNVDRYKATLIEAGDATGELMAANDKLSDSFENVFDEIIEGGEASRASLRKLIASFVEYIFTAQKAGSVQPFTNTTQGTSTGILTGAASSIGNAIGSAFSGVTDFIGGLFKANGGPVMQNMPYIVGERGPELFVPKISGNIEPNGSFGGGGPISINISALDGADVMRVLSQNRREISEMVAGTTRTYGLT